MAPVYDNEFNPIINSRLVNLRPVVQVNDLISSSTIGKTNGNSKVFMQTNMLIPTLKTLS